MDARERLLVPLLLVTIGLGSWLLGAHGVLGLACFALQASPDCRISADARHVKPVLLLLSSQEVVYLGGSRAMQSLRPAIHHPFAVSMNGSFSGASPYEVRVMAEHAIATSSVKELVVSVPYMVYLRDPAEADRIEERRFVGAAEVPWAPYAEIWNSAFRWIDLARAYPRLHTRWPHIEDLLEPDGVQIQHTTLLACGRPSESFHRKDLDRYRERYQAFVRTPARDAWFAAHLQELHRMLAHAQSAGVSVRLVILPVHESIHALRVMAGLTEHYHFWLTALSEAARTYHAIGPVAFDSIPGITDEPFERSSECPEGSLRWWFNPSHGTEAGGNLLQISPDSPGPVAGQNLHSHSSLAQYKSDSTYRYKRLGIRCSDVDGLLQNCFVATHGE